MSLNPSKTKYMILTTRQKRQLLYSLSAHLSVGNQHITEVSDHKVLGVTTDNNLSWGAPILVMCEKIRQKRPTSQQKWSVFLNFMPEKRFSSQQILSVFLTYRPAIKIVLLKRTSLTDKDYKTAQILPLSPRLICNKAHFDHKSVLDRAPIYLSAKSLINQSSRNSSR